MNFSEIEFILTRLDSITLELFSKIKEKADKTGWLTQLISKYGSEEKIPWRIRRKALFKAISTICVSKRNDTELKEKARELLVLWIYAKKLMFQKLNLTEEKLNNVFRILAELHERQRYPVGLFIWNPSHGDLKREIIRNVIAVSNNYDKYVVALDIGFYLNKILRNVSPLIALGLILPSIDPENADTYLSEAETALKLFMIKDYWYSFIEKREKPDYEHWEFWTDFLREMKKKQG